MLIVVKFFSAESLPNAPLPSSFLSRSTFFENLPLAKNLGSIIRKILDKQKNLEDFAFGEKGVCIA